jgi:hypothetical protein
MTTKFTNKQKKLLKKIQPKNESIKGKEGVPLFR